MLNIKKLFTKTLEMLSAKNIDHIHRDSLTGTIASVAANSYADCVINRPSGTFLGATIGVSGTSLCVPWLQTVGTSTITVRVRNVSASTAASNVGVSVYFLYKS